MWNYFTFSQNSEKHGPLHCTTSKVINVGARSLCAQEFDFGGLQSMDTKVLLSCPAIVPMSVDEEASEDSNNDSDLSGDNMQDFDDNAFVDVPSHGGTKR